MSEGPGDERIALVVTEPGFVDLFPELEDGTDLGVVEYLGPGNDEVLDLTGDIVPGAA
jgi:hypothetical protein